MNKHSFEKKSLFGKVNTRTHGVRHGCGGEARWSRHSKTAKREAVRQSKMRSGLEHGLDYTPLYRFLLNKVGHSWDALYSEALKRLPKEDPIWYMVAQTNHDQEPFFRSGESSYFSCLFVDDDETLQRVAPNVVNELLWPSCRCCTHSFNGQTFVNGYDPEKEATIFQVLSSYHNRTSA